MNALSVACIWCIDVDLAAATLYTYFRMKNSTTADVNEVERLHFVLGPPSKGQVLVKSRTTHHVVIASSGCANSKKSSRKAHHIPCFASVTSSLASSGNAAAPSECWESAGAVCSLHICVQHAIMVLGHDIQFVLASHWCNRISAAQLMLHL